MVINAKPTVRLGFLASNASDVMYAIDAASGMLEMVMIKPASSLTALLTRVVATGFACWLVSSCLLCAADDPKAGRTGLTAPPPRSVGSVAGPPAVSLFRGGPERTGSVSGSHLPERPVVQWTTLFPSSLGQPLLADKDRIIVADYSGKVSAVDFDGLVIWQHDVVADAPMSPTGFDGGRARTTGSAARPQTAASDGTSVFLPIFDQSQIAVIDLKAGRRRWSFQAKGWIYGEPTVTDDRVFFGSQDNNLYCLDKKRKTLFWTFPTKSRIEAGAGYQDGSVYFGSCDGRFYRVNAHTGKEVWSYQTPQAKGTTTAIYSAPLCTEDAVYFGSFDGHLYCLKIENGQLKWRIRPEQDSEIVGSPLTDGRRIVLTIEHGSRQVGRHAIVVIGEEEGKE
jgi:outer membrane protein assembly factor BamB